jgi:Tol biopolymer transport system component
VESIAWGPDAKTIAVVAKRPTEKTAALYLLPLSSGAPERISADGEEVLGVSGTASEPWRLVYWVSDKGGISVRERQPSGERRAVDVGGLKVKSAAVSADGSALYFIAESGGERGVFATPATGAGARLLVSDRSAFGSPAISADRSYLAWPTEENGQKRIAMASIEGRGTRSVVTAPARSPSFLPGTTRLLFSSDIDAAGGEIYAADLGPEAPGNAAAARPERITFGQAENPVAAPTGRIIAFTSRRGGPTPDLYLARWVDDP